MANSGYDQPDPSPILSSVYSFPRCCLMPSEYGEDSRRDGQEAVVPLRLGAFTPFNRKDPGLHGCVGSSVAV